jgi:hypothetical protein
MAPRSANTKAKTSTTKAKPAAARKRAAKKPSAERHPGAAPIEDAVAGAEERAQRRPHRLIADKIAEERGRATANSAPVPLEQRGA